MQIINSKVDFKNFITSYIEYRVNNEKTYLIILHGGPGSTCNSYKLIAEDIAIKSNINVLLYDQFGCGKSSQTDDFSLYNKDTWVEELDNIIEKLNIENVYLLGHSWGGMLSIIYLCDYKKEKVKKLILSSTLSSTEIWKQEAYRLIKYLPLKDQKAIKIADETNNYTSKEFLNAYKHYKEKYIGPKKSEIKDKCLLEKKIFGKDAYSTSWGASEFTPKGNLKDYDYTNKLSNIKCPTLIISGTDDESTPYINKIMYDNLVCEKYWKLLPNARHMAYYDKKEEYISTVVDFLKK